jgi:hopanoid C-3 methylase
MHQRRVEPGEYTKGRPTTNVRGRLDAPQNRVLPSPPGMNVLLLRPVPRNERFGLGPFFRIEPLGMEYVAAALEAAGHHVTLVDLRFGRRLEHCLRTARPDVVGIACMHALEYDDAVSLATEVRRQAPEVRIIVGGHSAAAYPRPFFDAAIDAVVIDDGERAVPAAIAAIERGEPLAAVPGLVVVSEDGFAPTASALEHYSLDAVALPSRAHTRPFRRHYACLAHRPAWLVETARGCPFRCSFCSVWQMYDRSVRERGIGAVTDDFSSVGDHVFVADDLFFNHEPRSRELAQALLARGLRKEWVLVQSRVDTVARHPELLEAWRPLAREFDIFFGFEAPTDEGLRGLTKDTTVERMREGIAVARETGFGVTGNFVIDPAWTESDFERLWAFVEEQRLFQAGFTILTPLPGTAYYEEMRASLRAVEWAQFDMHHLLWEPRLGVERFFDLYSETWRRSVLNLGGQKRWRDWLRDVEWKNALFLLKALRRTQRLMDAGHYLREHRFGPAGLEPRARAGALETPVATGA